jgi:Ca2+-binding RTX toxin-like protein
MPVFTLSQHDLLDGSTNTFLASFLAEIDRASTSNSGTTVIFSSSIRFTPSSQGGNHNIAMSGTNLDFVLGSGGIADIIGGTFRSVTYTLTGDVVVQGTGLNVNAAALFDAALGGNPETCASLLFAGKDTVRGSGGDDFLGGFGGNDKLFGNNGNDRMVGGAGRDTLHGDAGRDTLTGDGGADAFVFDTARRSSNIDTIVDFTSGSDRLRFDRGDFAGAGPVGQLQQDRFIAGASAADDEDRFIYVESTGKLYFDRDGEGGQGRELIANLGAGTSLDFGDIYLF